MNKIKTASECLESFLEYKRTIQNYSQLTIKEYYYDIMTFFTYLKLKKNINIDIEVNELSKLKLVDFHEYVYWLKNEKQNSDITRSRKVSSIRVFFKYLSNNNYIDKNPAYYLETPKKAQKIVKNLNLSDTERLLNNIKYDDTVKYKERNFAIITLFLNCGMRLAELANINIEDINFNDMSILLHGKGNKERLIYFNNSCLKALNDYLNVRVKEETSAFFKSSRNVRISRRSIQAIVKQYLQKSGLGEYSTHKLRHTAATLMYQYGNVDIRVLQELLGHDTIVSTQVYTHVDNAQIRSACERNPLANE